MNSTNGSATATAYCTSCGARRGPTGNFCAGCGTALEPSHVESPENGAHNGSPLLADTIVMPPPATEPSDDPVGRFPRVAHVLRGKRAIAAAVVTAALGVACAYLIVDPFNGDADVARHELSARGQSVAAVLGAAERARRIESMRAVGSLAQRRLAVFDASLASLRDIGDDDIRATATGVIGHERELLAGFAQLETLNEANLEPWNGIALGLTRAASGLAGDRAAVGELDLGQSSLPRARRLNAAVEGLDTRIAAADRELTAWRTRYRAARRAQRADLDALNGYADAVRGQLGRYSGLRTALSDWIDEYGAEQLPFGEAEGYLSQAISERQEVRNALAGLAAPAGLEAEHARIGTVVDQALRAMENAVDGARECTEDLFCLGEDFRDTVDWREFARVSDEISTEYPSATSDWEARVGAEAKRIKDRRLPAPPRV
jgi:hypothetical protein